MGYVSVPSYNPLNKSPSKPKRDAVFFGKLKQIFLVKPKSNKQTGKKETKYCVVAGNANDVAFPNPYLLDGLKGDSNRFLWKTPR